MCNISLQLFKVSAHRLVNALLLGAYFCVYFLCLLFHIYFPYVKKYGIRVSHLQ